MQPATTDPTTQTTTPTPTPTPTMAGSDTTTPKGAELLKQSATDPAGRGSSARILAFFCAVMAAFLCLRSYDLNTWKAWLDGAVWLVAYSQASKAGEGAIRAAFEAWQAKQSRASPFPTPAAPTPTPQANTPQAGKK